MQNFFPALLLSLGLVACAVQPGVPAEPLQEREWRLADFGGPTLSLAPGQPVPSLFLGAEQRAHGSDGCNRFNGNYDLSQGLRFERLASTRMACPPAQDEVARHFGVALAAVRSFRVAGALLELLDGDGRVLARFKADAPK